MKLVIAVVQRRDASACVDALTGVGISCTRLRSSGGFLERPNETLIIGTSDGDVERVINLLRLNVQQRVESLEHYTPTMVPGNIVVPAPVDVEVSGATIMVVPMEVFEKL